MQPRRMQDETPTTHESSLHPEEVGALYARYKHELVALCQRITGDAASAEDALHSAMVKLLRHGASVRTADCPRAWLFKAVAHCCYDAVRARARIAEVRRAQTGAMVQSSSPLSLLEARDTIMQAHLALTESELVLARQHFLDAVDQGELAEQYLCARQTVHLRLNRIREKIRLLHDGDFTPPPPATSRIVRQQCREDTPQSTDPQRLRAPHSRLAGQTARQGATPATKSRRR